MQPLQGHQSLSVQAVNMRDYIEIILLLMISILLGVFLSAMYPEELYTPLAFMSRE